MNLVDYYLDENPCFSELGNNFYCFSLGRFFTDLASTNHDFTNLGNYVRSTYGRLE